MTSSSRALLVAAVALVLGTGASSVAAGATLPVVRPDAARPPVSATVTKLLVVVEENHSLSQMQAEMPYTFGLATTYGYADNYVAITHPSLPNYLAIASGSTHGITDDAGPSSHPLVGRSVFGQAVLRGRTAAVYAEGAPARCAVRDAVPYVVRHNPWTYFVRERELCRTHDFGLKRFAADVTTGNLPRVGLLVPDVDHDAHDGSLAEADAWFESVMTQVFASPDWQSGHLAVVLTADEDDRAHSNRVLTVVIHPSQTQHLVTSRLGHFALTRLYEDVAELPYLGKARVAPSMADAFGLPVP